jgi:hypothetical protein
VNLEAVPAGERRNTFLYTDEQFAENMVFHIFLPVYVNFTHLAESTIGIHVTNQQYKYMKINDLKAFLLSCMMSFPLKLGGHRPRRAARLGTHAPTPHSNYRSPGP